MILKASMTVKCDGPTCGITETWESDNLAVDDGRTDWIMSKVQDLCPKCAKIQSRVMESTKYNYLKHTPIEVVKRFSPCIDPHSEGDELGHCKCSRCCGCGASQ